MKENESVTKLMGFSKRKLRGKFRAINAYIKKEDPKSSSLILYLTELEKIECAKASTRKELMKIRAEVHEIVKK